MTELLFRDEPYLRRCAATVVAAEPGGIELDRTLFYPRGGGQPGDQGVLRVPGGASTPIVDTVHGEGGRVLHVPAPDAALPAAGTTVECEIEWARRHVHMRMHTCLHLLGAVLKFPVTGGNVGAERSRLDFDMPEAPDREDVEEALNALIRRDAPVRSFWISEEELDARPDLVRTLSVSPPRGAGRIRLIEIPGIDLQPCGGTHVARTGEIGTARVTRIDKKGKMNRRVYVELAGTHP